MKDPAELVAWYVVFVFSSTLHEAAHALVAKLLGDETAYMGGQVTLDPRPHIRREPVGMVLMPIVGLLVTGFPFGFASAPYNVHWAHEHPRRAGLMAAAGPFANLLLALVAAAALTAMVRTGVADLLPYVKFSELVHVHPGNPALYAIARVATITLALNFLLFVLNLLPCPPLDGSAVINLLIPEHLARRAQKFIWGTPWLDLVGFIIVWQCIDYVFWPPYMWFLRLVFPVS